MHLAKSWMFVLSVFLRVSHGDIQAFCPLKEVEAIIGYDVLLPCYTKPEINLSGSTLDWQRPDKQEIVFLYRNQKDDPQMEKYAAQMKVDHLGLQRGNLSLLILSVGPPDSGVYKCYLPHYRTGCEVQLHIVNRTREDVSTVSPSTRAADPSHADAANHLGVLVAALFTAAVIVVFIVVMFGAALMKKLCWSRELPV